MLDSIKNAKERWGGVHQIIDRWLNERQEVIVLFCAINGLQPYAPKDTPVPVKIQAFCQVLMDYCSAGHFEIYEQLVKEAQDFNDGSVAMIKEIYPQLEEITAVCVSFNDKYDTPEHCQQKISQLDADLSRLGELLEERFDLEDKLIENLHNAHKELVA
ncbi:MAG: sigma D regulator [Oceanospirillaceae bacterium]|nr:sigma D regulator [Oceanospirillaceae bacterium]MCP5335266.1 sigma D regulator [Oceanospirillaceae bacterium]MCP5350418.1 sigma D regulator [Oceanospirillaceae bacterium]